MKYSDLSRKVFDRALDGLEKKVPTGILAELRRLLEAEEIDDAAAIRRIVQEHMRREPDSAD